MKTRVFLFISALVLFACKPDEEQTYMRIDPESFVYIKAKLTPAYGSKAPALFSDTIEHLTPLEVVKQTTVMTYHNDLISSDYCAIIWLESLKDTTPEDPALLRFASDIIHDKDGYGHYGLQTDFIYGYDMVLCRSAFPHYDTIAYIPNAYVISARDAILASLEAMDTAAVYDVFQNAFRFIPITGIEYRELKEKGLN